MDHPGSGDPPPLVLSGPSSQNLDVLVVDDHPDTLDLLHELLTGYSVRVTTASCCSEALDTARRISPAVVLVDYVLPDSNGLDLLQDLLKEHPQALVILMSAYSTVQMAVEAVRRGALDVLNKPFKLDELDMVLQRALRVAALLAESRVTYGDLRERFLSPYMVGESAPFLEALHLASQVAATDATVLVTGESGTGKELIARALHTNSRRAQKPFFPLNCSAIPDTLLESELFGYRRGAFTGADEDRPGILDRAAGGTVFLDEISETSPAFQAKLLRVLQNREFLPLGASALRHCDVRVLVATNKPLDEWVAQGRFREDLFFRINGFQIHLPPLRERREDVPLLALSFLREIANTQKFRAKGLSAEAIRALRSYHWPGNIRELRNKMEMACILCQSDLIQPKDLFPRRSINPIPYPGDLPFAFPDEGISLASVERGLLKTALEKAEGNTCAAARLLGLSRATFRYRCSKYRISSRSISAKTAHYLSQRRSG
jgi:two-component system NtrC family response regulator